MARNGFLVIRYALRLQAHLPFLIIYPDIFIVIVLSD